MLRQIFFFAVAGIIGLIVDVAVLYALHAAVGPFYGRAVSFCAAVVATWLVNRSFTFRNRHSGLSVPGAGRGLRGLQGLQRSRPPETGMHAAR